MTRDVAERFLQDPVDVATAGAKAAPRAGISASADSMKRLATLLVATALTCPLAAGADSSAIGTFLNLEFSGKLVTDSSWNDQSTIADQMLYLIGQLNGYEANGRLDKAVVSNVVKTSAGGKVQITYRAKVPMIWSKRSPVPATIELSLPLDISYQGQSAFAASYGHDCVDLGAHDVDAGSMFYYFRPRAPGCTIAAADVHKASGTVSPSPVQTTGKFPEYNRVWEDNTLNVVAIFGKYEDGATTSSDAGISAYNAFISSMKSEFGAGHATQARITRERPTRRVAHRREHADNFGLPDPSRGSRPGPLREEGQAGVILTAAASGDHCEVGAS